MLCTGVVTGPLMGAFMLGRGYSATAVYYMQVISGAAHSLLLLLFLQETLPTDQREPFRGFRCASNELSGSCGHCHHTRLRGRNPFAFTTLFRRGRKLSMLCASCGLACFADGGNLNDIEQMWIKNE